MYQFSKKLKLSAVVLMIVGIAGIGYGFLSTPSSVEEVAEMLKHKNDDHHNDHGGGAHNNHDAHGVEHVNEVNAHDAHSNDNHNAHAEHVFHQLKNRPWAAVYVALFFAFLITLGVLAFYAIQRVALSGWPIVLFRVMEGITGNLLPITLILLVFLLLSAAHFNHLFVWMNPENFDPNSPHYDPIVDGKSFWLNIPGWIVRAVIFIAGWNLYRHFSRKKSLAQDNANNLKAYKKNYLWSVLFLLFFLYSESMMSWDWIMSLDPHWFSTLFGWYVFAGMIVSSITVIAMVTVYLKSKGVLPFVNNSHLHDLAKFMFGFSIFWTYLFFSQFMLIWYADMAEETTYFVQRFQEYKLPFLSMIAMNFIFPVLLLMNSDYKRIPYFVLGAGVVVLIGHYIDTFILIMPATVGDQWQFGIPEFSAILFFTGLFIYSVFTTLTKAPLLAKGNPFVKESETFHY